MRGRVVPVIAVVALAALVAAVLAATDASWYLSCTGSGGEPLGGIDCLSSTPRTESEPARSFGFWGLAAAGWAALVALCLCATTEILRRRAGREQA